MRLKTVLCMFVLCFFFSSMPVAELAVKYGDVNRDGRVTMTDVSILLQYCQGGRPASSLDLVAADVNGDGKVNILDVTMMKEYVVGRISSFPAEKNSVSQNQSQSNRSNSQSQARTNASNSQSKPQANVQTVPSGAVVIKSDGWYRISPLHAPGRALDVGGARMEAGANLQLWDYSGVPQQKFYLENRGNGYYTLRAGHSNLYVDAQGGVPRNGENVHQFTYNGSAAQLWRLIDAGGGAVYIETKMQPGLSFDCANRQGTNGTNVQLWERGNVDWNKWKLTPVDAPPPPTVYPKDGWYRIATAYNNNIGLDIGGARTDSTANVQLWSYTGVPQQKFYLQARGNGYYSVKSGNCDMYVDVAGGNSNNGTNVWQYSYNGTGTQLWKFLDAGNGTVWMESKVKPNLVLDARTNQAGNGGNVQVWTRENVAWHKWKLVPVTPPEIVKDITLDWDKKVGSQVANINTRYYTSDNISYNANHKGECTWYAYGRFYEVTGIKLKTARHAKYWLDENRGDNRVAVTNQISSESIAVNKTNGHTRSGEIAGHVMFIEYVSFKNAMPEYVYFTEDNWNSRTNRKVQKMSYADFKNKRNPVGYIRKA